jgi:hypothetical protein
MIFLAASTLSKVALITLVPAGLLLVVLGLFYVINKMP